MVVLVNVTFRFRHIIKERAYFAVGMIEAPDPKALGFAVGNPREFLMLSADPMALMPFKVLGRRE